MTKLEKVIKGIFEMLQRNTWKDIDDKRHRFQPVLNGALELLKEQQAEIDRLKAEKDEIIRKIGHARIDNIAPTDAKSTEVIYKHGVIDGLAYAQDIVNGKAGEQE